MSRRRRHRTQRRDLRRRGRAPSPRPEEHVAVPRGRLDIVMESVDRLRKDVEALRSDPTISRQSLPHRRRRARPPQLTINALMALFYWHRLSALRLTPGHSRFVFAILHPDEQLAVAMIDERAANELGSVREGAASPRTVERSRDATIEEIRKQDPALADHFTRTVRVERDHLIYRPAGIVWKIDRRAPPGK